MAEVKSFYLNCHGLRMWNFLEHFQEVFDNLVVEPQEKSKYWESEKFNFKMNLIWMPYMFSFQEMEEGSFYSFFLKLKIVYWLIIFLNQTLLNCFKLL